MKKGEGLSARDLVYVIFPIILGALMGYLLSSGNSMLALIALAVAIPAAFLLSRAMMVRAVRRGEVLFDEMHMRIREKASSLALTLSIIAIALIGIVIIWPTFFDIYIVPREVVERLYPGLGLSFAILVISLWVSYAYYARLRKVVEG